MEDTLDRLGQTIKSALGASVTGYTVARGELTVDARADDVIKVATFLRDDPACRFINIIDVTAVDWPSRAQRFDVDHTGRNREYDRSQHAAGQVLEGSG